MDSQRAAHDEKDTADDREYQVHTSVNWGTHKTADEQSNNNDYISDEGARREHHSVLISGDEGVVMQTD